MSMSANDTPATAVALKEIELEFTHGGYMTIPANQHLFGYVNGDFFYFTHIEFKGVRQSEEIPCRIPVKMLDIQLEKKQD